jgi:hypothetical protein
MVRQPCKEEWAPGLLMVPHGVHEWSSPRLVGNPETMRLLLMSAATPTACYNLQFLYSFLQFFVV